MGFILTLFMEKARIMFKKILQITGAVSLSVLCACVSNMNDRPVARNKPKTLPLGESKNYAKKNSYTKQDRIAPITDVSREFLFNPYSKVEIFEDKDDLSDILEDMSYAPKITIMEESSKNPDIEDTQEEEIRKENTLSLKIPSKRKSEDGNFRVALLLPLGTQNAKVAQDLKNAATMALFDTKSDNTIMQIYPTDGTYDSAKVKAKIAYKDGADVIVGPLFADEVKGVKSAVGGDIPVVSFTTDPSAIGKDVYSIGFLMEQQIKRIVEYATEKGKTKFGIIVPNSESGKLIQEYFETYTPMYGAEIVTDVSYNKNSKDLMNAVKEVSGFDERKEEYDAYKKAVKERYEYLLKLRDRNVEKFATAFDKEQFSSSEDEISALEKELGDLEKKMTISGPKFDSVFIFGDDINDVVMIGSALMYYDVHPDKVKYLGTAQLENPKVYNERAFRGAWFPSVSTKYSGKFDVAYKKYFNRDPIKIASLAYDSISLVNSIGEGKGYLDGKDLLNPNGWTGINGIFRFKADGASERNMDIKEVVGGATVKTKIISPAKTNFLHY